MVAAPTARRNTALGDRLREVREEKFGPAGAPVLADALGLPARTWLNYEQGVTIPGEVVLRVIALAGVEPHWLLTGQGPRYRSGEEAAASFVS
jgi:hypothetical protein